MLPGVGLFWFRSLDLPVSGFVKSGYDAPAMRLSLCILVHVIDVLMRDDDAAEKGGVLEGIVIVLKRQLSSF